MLVLGRVDFPYDMSNNRLDEGDVDSDAILAYYYQYPSANTCQYGDTRRLRAASPSAVPSGSSTTGLTSTPSQGGTDRRRLAIVEMEGSIGSDSGGGPPSHSRPRFEAKLQVAPPVDASPRSPSDAFAAFPKLNIGHVPRKSSREVAIVGTASFPESASLPQQSSHFPLTSDSLRPPIFQIPQSRSPSPGVSDISDSGCSTSRGRQRKDALAPCVSPVKEVKESSTPVRTPNTSRSKHISDRVAGPVVINLFPHSPSTSPVFSSTHSSTQDLMSPRTSLSSPLTPSTALTSPVTTPASYLHYQPGLHATAGPLPTPPKAVFTTVPITSPPPRPPRHSPMRRKDELEAMKQTLQLPPHVSAALKGKSSSPSSEKEVVSTSPHKVTATVPSGVTPPTDSPQSSHESFDSDLKPHHVREGAFPPSRLCTLDPIALRQETTISLPRLDSMDDLVASIGLAIDDMGIINSSDVPPPTVVEPPRGHEGRSSGKGLEIRRADNLKLSVSHSLSPERPRPSSPHSDESMVQAWVDPDKTLTRLEETVPPVPAKSDLPCLDTKSLKNALNIKRFSSLPRTPSLMSLNRPSIGSKRSSGTPSPSVSHSVPRLKPPVRRTKSTHPPAMFFADVTVKRTALERSIGYAYKINELYSCDCGLGDWITETRYKALHPHSSIKRSVVNSSRGPRAPSTSSPSIAPRHMSQSSTDSGVTFPIRADAYSATDLAPRSADESGLPNAPPSLPYPALIVAPRSGPSRASTMIATSSTSSGRSAVSPSVVKTPGSFFASLGRRASIKKDKPLTPPSPPKTLSKNPPRNGNEQPSPRPTNLPLVAPSVPGGPRAPPNRMQRSQTIIVTSQNSTDGTNSQHSSIMTRRPSLFGGRGSTQQDNGLISGAEFNRQVDKLAALLPGADRNVLAIYLRRAGQDILAIGQYLEDEKNGKLRYE